MQIEETRLSRPGALDRRAVRCTTTAMRDRVSGANLRLPECGLMLGQLVSNAEDRGAHDLDAGR